ncbi:MAG: response regulator [Acidimicrobiales bacterium]|nr:response regulator [Acidimicrobiales bacterium]
MSGLAVLVVEDEPEVRDALVHDLAALRGSIRVEAAEDVDDARAALAELTRAGDRVGLVLADHRLPGTSGVDFLVELHQDPATRPTRKVLVTGQADQADTIQAVNEADLDHYIAKPWQPHELLEVARTMLTAYVIDQRLDPLPFVRDLDGPRLLEAFSRRAADR